MKALTHSAFSWGLHKKGKEVKSAEEGFFTGPTVNTLFSTNTKLWFEFL